MTKYRKTPSEVLPGRWVTHIDPQEGRFKEGDFVLIAGQVYLTAAEILLVVPARSYAHIEVARRGLSLKVPQFRGFWREHESYVVRDEGGHIRWPRVGCLTLFIPNVGEM